LKIGDFDPRHAGNELLCVTAVRVWEFYKDENGTWIKENMSGYLPRIYKCDIGNFDPRFDGNECVIFTENNIAEYAWNGSGWYSEWISTLGKVPTGRVGEIWSWNNVSEIVCVDGSSHGIVIVWWDNTSYERKDVVYDITLGGSLSIGDCWSGHEGNEIVVGAEVVIGDKACYLLWEENGEWEYQVIFTDGWVGDVEVGEFDYLHPGLEIAYAAYGLYELYEEPPVSETTSPFMLFVCPLIAVPAVLFVIREWRK